MSSKIILHFQLLVLSIAYAVEEIYGPGVLPHLAHLRETRKVRRHRLRGGPISKTSFDWPRNDPYFLWLRAQEAVCFDPNDQPTYPRKYCVVAPAYDGCLRILPSHHWFDPQPADSCCRENAFVGCAACNSGVSIFQYCREHKHRDGCWIVFNELEENGCGELLEPYWDHYEYLT